MSVQYIRGLCSTLGVFSTLGGYHNKCGGRSLGKRLICMKTLVYCTSPSVLMISPHTHYWYSHSVLMVSPHCTEHPPPPGVLMISLHCTHDISLVYSPSVLHRHCAGWEFWSERISYFLAVCKCNRLHVKFCTRTFRVYIGCQAN